MKKLISESFMGSKTIFMEIIRTNFFRFKPVKDGHDWNSETKVSQVSL